MNKDMTLEQVIAHGRDIAVICREPSCGAVTPLSPAFFAARVGGRTTLARLAERLSCAGCGGRAITIEEWSDPPPPPGGDGSTGVQRS